MNNPVYCQSFRTAKFSKVTQLVPVACKHKVLICMFTTKPCDKLSGNTNISFKHDNDKTVSRSDSS
jgi:hypothetical protein